MSEGAPAPAKGSTDEGLPWKGQGLILALAVILFTFTKGPIWRHPYDIDLAVLVSYAAIPLLVVVGLLLVRRWSVRWALLDSAILLTIKFGITYVATALLWSVAGPPPQAVRAPPDPEQAPPRPVRIPTPLDPARLSLVQGMVHSANGKPVPHALVYVSGGLEDLVFAPLKEPVKLINDGTGFLPPLQAVQVGEPVVARSSDARLHTVRVYGADRVLLNVPAITRQAEHRFSFDEAHGETRVVCGVHEASGTERASRLVVLDHPFFTTADESGAFQLTGVPSRPVTLRVVGESGCAGSMRVDLQPGAGPAVTLTCDAPETAAAPEARGPP